jgi:Prolyl oligopeptidase family
VASRASSPLRFPHSVSEAPDCLPAFDWGDHQRCGSNGTAYPAVLLTAGENDTRVDAWHAKKMTARLQEATSSDRPVLLRLESTGHLAGSLDQSIDVATDRHAFLFDQLGLGYRRVAPA